MEPKKILIGWQEYIGYVGLLFDNIIKHDWRPDHIVAISRGGLIAGVKLSFLFKSPLAVVAAESYSKDTRDDRLIISRHMVYTTPTISGKILIVDDLTETGETLKRTTEYVGEKFKDNNPDIKTAVIIHKEWSKFTPDFFAIQYCCDKNGQIPWIIQPWEE